MGTMLLNEITKQVHELSRTDKLRLMQVLIFELADNEKERLALTTNSEYEVWSPFDAFDAADTLQRMLAEHQKARHE